MLLISILLIVLISLLTFMLGSAKEMGSRPVHLWLALAAVGQATLFFGYALVRPADPIDAWGIQRFYGVFCVLVVVTASAFIQKEYRAPARSVARPPTAADLRAMQAPDDSEPVRTPPKPVASVPGKPRGSRATTEPAGKRVDGRR